MLRQNKLECLSLAFISDQESAVPQESSTSNKNWTIMKLTPTDNHSSLICPISKWQVKFFTGFYKRTSSLRYRMTNMLAYFAPVCGTEKCFATLTSSAKAMKLFVYKTD
jgi:hypothetical protein